MATACPVSVDSRLVSFTDATIAHLPRVIRPLVERHHELIKFAIVGATTFVIDSGLFYTLKLTVLAPKPITAKIISGVVAVIASYVLNREWSFRGRGGRERHHEALLFFAFSGVGVLLSMAPLWFSHYVLQLRVPTVSLTLENITDFISAYVIGNLLQMAFRFWAFRRWVFPDESARSSEATLTAGGIAEVFEDVEESGTVTLLGNWRARRDRVDQLGDSSDPRVSKTS